MTVSTRRRSLAAVVALVVSMSVGMVLFALAPQAMARAGKPACAPASTAHPGREARACAEARRTSTGSGKAFTGAAKTSKGSGKGGTHGSSKGMGRGKGKGRRVKHAGKKKGARTKRPKRKRKAAKLATRAIQVPAICEDGSAPAKGTGGAFSCEDGLEPVCANGSAPVLSSSGSAVLCDVSAGDSGADGAVCEDGSPPIQGGDGSFACDDQSEPICEDGAVPTPSDDGSSLVCGEEPDFYAGPVEAACEDGSIPTQTVGGYFVCSDGSGPVCESGSPTPSSDGSTLLCMDAVSEDGES